MILIPILLTALTVLGAASAQPFAEQVQRAYAHERADTLRVLRRQADSRADSLMVRYRLYPLTEDASVLDDIPEELPDGTAREQALLSGLWAYRAGEASIFRVVQYGRRSASLLEAAKAQDADDPFVLLVEGQSLLFRPAIAGRDAAAAADRFAQLAHRLQDTTGTGISETEAQVWRWLALREAGDHEAATALRDDLKAQDLAPLYQQFLEDPPEV